MILQSLITLIRYMKGCVIPFCWDQTVCRFCCPFLSGVDASPAYRCSLAKGLVSMSRQLASLSILCGSSVFHCPTQFSATDYLGDFANGIGTDDWNVFAFVKSVVVSYPFNRCELSQQSSFAFLYPPRWWIGNNHPYCCFQAFFTRPK